jgi:hypothetical protein
MCRIFLLLAACAIAFQSVCAEPARILEKPQVLPLSLKDEFEFRKTKTFLHDPEVQRNTIDPVLFFERQRLDFGAINDYERRHRHGNYFAFFWRSKRAADLKVRFEYRQEKLGANVQAKERVYSAAKGSFKTEFDVTGDDYRMDGKVIAWRVVLIENGTIVALNQSFLWN